MSMSTRLKLASKLGIDYPIFLSPMAGVSTIDMSIGVSNNGGLGSIPLASIDFRKQDSIEKLENLIIEYKKKLINSTTTKTKTKTKDNDQLVVNLNFFCHEIENEPNQQQISNWKQLYKQSVFDNNTEDDDAFKLLDEIQFINGNVSFKEIENNENHIDQYNKLMEYLEQLKPSIISFHFGMPSPKTIKRLQNQGIMIFITSTSLEETIYLTNNNNNNNNNDDDAKIDGIILQGGGTIILL
ncbi:nitronate monooxygenase [Candida albicans P76055]|nr:nitronate monooxygenase [Candida albicans P76055]